MSCFDSPVRVVSSARSPHMNCFEVDCPVAVGEVVVCCRTAHFEAGNYFGLNLWGDMWMLVFRRVVSTRSR